MGNRLPIRLVNIALPSLFIRLSLVFTLILLLIGVATWFISRDSQHRYFEEYSQALNRPVAMYMATRVPFFTKGEFNQDALVELQSHISMINPSLDIYILDAQGTILAADQPLEDLNLPQVDVEPLLRFIDGPDDLTITGENPRNGEERRVFSAFSIGEETFPGAGCTLCGYVYVILGGDHYVSVWQSISNRYSLRSSTVLFVCVVLVSLIFGILLFHWLTKPLLTMTQSIAKWQLVAGQNSQLKKTQSSHSKWNFQLRNNELVELEKTCRLMAERIQKQFAILQQADSNRREFLKNVSHDLRTPLTGLAGAIETLADKRAHISDDQQLRLLHVAQRQAKRLKKLVGQVFDLARLDSGDIRMNFERITLMELVSDAAQDLEPYAASRGVKLQVSCTESACNLIISADTAWLHRVLDNLIVNAVKHCNPGGRVKIELLSQQGKFVIISIRDTGVGFEKALSGVPLKKLVQVQRYVSSLTVKSGEPDSGTGLGLGIVVKVLSLHKSYARVWSKPNVGCCIRFAFHVVA